MLLAFLSALSFAGPEKYFILILVNFFVVSKHDLLKRLWTFVHSHLTPTFVCSVGPSKQASGYAALIYM